MAITQEQFKDALASTDLQRDMLHIMGWKTVRITEASYLVSNKTLPGCACFLEWYENEVTFEVRLRIPHVSINEYIVIPTTLDNLYELMLWGWLPRWENYNETTLKNSFYLTLLNKIRRNWWVRLELAYELYGCKRLGSMSLSSFDRKDYELKGTYALQVSDTATGTKGDSV